MNTNDDLDRLLREHLSQTANSRPAEGALEAILATTAGIRPKRSFGENLERLVGAGLVRLGLRLSPTAARLVLAVLLVALLLAATVGSALLGGGRNQPLLVVPPSLPTATPSISPSPSLVVAVLPSPIVLPKTFTSKLYHDTIGIGSKWTVEAATVPIDSKKSTDATAFDVITVTGTDTTIPIAASVLGSQSFESWLKAIQTTALTDRNTPLGCDGGDPSTWPAVTVGGRQGVWQQMCNYAVAYVDVDGDAYQFAWANGTLETSEHLSIADFKTVLESVTFP
jgi:hypothetical protein